MVIVLLALGALAVGPCRAAQDWQSYSNQRYGFHLQYPANVFTLERSAKAGDGELFVAKDGDARLLVGSLTNASRFTPASYQQYVAQNSYPDYRIHYRRLGDSWFALSGEGNGNIFYEKAMFSCAGRLITSFAMIYGSDRRQAFDRIVERIENSFRPGHGC
jgi:hypothetical protein